MNEHHGMKGPVRCSLAVGLACLGAAALPAPADDWFVDAAKERNLAVRHHNGAAGDLYFPEIMCGGAAWLDYDNDGDLDLYVVQAHKLPKRSAKDIGNQLFRNDGGTFKEVSAASGADDRGYGNGVVCGDYDNDGLVDIYVSNFGPNVLYHNNGDGTFTNLAARAGVGDPRWSMSGAFVDYDLDGDLDLFVANYIDWTVETRHPCFGEGGRPDYCGPKSYSKPARDTLYRNNGDGTFNDVTEPAGLLEAERGNGLGVVTGDFDQDGRPDIYVANDGSENHIWLNQGGGKFLDDSLMMGCAVNEMGKAEAGMGVCAGDYDDDGDLDLFMVHLASETNTFYQYDDGMFEDVTTRLGLAGPSFRYTGLGAGFLDYDNDGRLDIFVGNGRVTHAVVPGPRGPFAEPNQLFRLTAEGKYVEVSSQAGRAFEFVDAARAVAFGDYDNDGDTDLVIVSMEDDLRLLENRIGSRKHWLGLRVKNKKGRYALGAVVTVVSESARRTRAVARAYSYAASNDPRILVGLGDSPVVKDVSVKWPGGRSEHFGPQQADRYVDLVESRGRTVGATAKR